MKLLNYFFNLLLFRGNQNPREENHSLTETRDGSIMCRAEDLDDIAERRKREEAERARERNRRTERPPVDDCCPICRGGFSVPCRTPCGHWFCGDCILQYWNHGAALRPCKCPMCSQLISSLIPASPSDRCEDVMVLQNLCEYNRVFVGGSYGFYQKMRAIPLFLRRLLHGMMDPDANYLLKVRLVAISLGALYAISPLDFLPTDRFAAVDLFDYSAIGLVFTMYMVGLYRRSQRMKQERLLAAAAASSSSFTADAPYA